jgi:hypothetical protein
VNRSSALDPKTLRFAGLQGLDDAIHDKEKQFMRSCGKLIKRRTAAGIGSTEGRRHPRGELR